MAVPRIRVAENADVLAMAELLERLVRKYVFQDCSRAGQALLLRSISPESLTANLASDYQYHVACTEAGMFGVVGLRYPGHLYHLFVADAVRGVGLGRKLWETARDAVCAENSVPPVFTVNSTLHAVGFYKALGWEQTGEVEERDGIKSRPMRYLMLRAQTRRA